MTRSSGAYAPAAFDDVPQDAVVVNVLPRSRDAYAWHRAALALAVDGRLSREAQATLGVQENTPACGFWRVPTERDHNGRYVPPHKGGAWAAVAIWWGADELMATIDGAPVDPVSVWSWCCRYPISAEEYERWELSLRGVIARAQALTEQNPPAWADPARPGMVA